jgi:hypothetical protein
MCVSRRSRFAAGSHFRPGRPDRRRAGAPAVVAALLAVCFARAAHGQEPAAGDSTRTPAADTTARADSLPAPNQAVAVPAAADSLGAAAADTTPPAAGAATVDSAVSAADSAAAESAVADSVAADSAEAAAADTLSRVLGGMEETRERLQDVQQALETFPEEDRLRYSPKGAVLRAFALPGWGQFYTGHTVRGFLYAGAEVGFATLGYIRQTQVLDLNDEIFQAKLDFVAADQALHPDSAYSTEDSLALYDRFESTPEGLALEAELHDKKKSREDFFTYAIFAVLFSAIDAFVSAHLEPFDKAELDLSPDAGGWRLDVHVPLGRAPASPP